MPLRLLLKLMPITKFSACNKQVTLQVSTSAKNNNNNTLPLSRDMPTFCQ
jgi:hypothetical protein